MELRELFLLAQLCDFHLKAVEWTPPRCDIWLEIFQIPPFACTV